MTPLLLLLLLMMMMMMMMMTPMTISIVGEQFVPA